MQASRGLGGAQSYPSRTKDKIPVDFSTGSVGLGVAITAFASLVQDYLIAHGQMAQSEAGRMIALMGDAELDEGNIYECLIEGYKHDLRNCWWIVDYNRQSLDSTTADRDVPTLRRHLRNLRLAGADPEARQEAARGVQTPRRRGDRALDRRLPQCRICRADLSGGAAWRLRPNADLAHDRPALALIASMEDAALSALMRNLGSHCIETPLEAFAEVDDERPTMLIA